MKRLVFGCLLLVTVVAGAGCYSDLVTDANGNTCFPELLNGHDECVYPDEPDPDPWPG